MHRERRAGAQAERVGEPEPHLGLSGGAQPPPGGQRRRLEARVVAGVADQPHGLAEPEGVGARQLVPRRGATTSNAGFLGILAAVLRGVGLAIGLVCLYALIQALAITARERRGAVAVLRAAGADRATVALVLTGAALAIAAPAALAAAVLERVALGPLVASLAAGFASLELAPTLGQVVLVVAGVLALSAVATAVVARRVMREPIVAGLREE